MDQYSDRNPSHQSEPSLPVKITRWWWRTSILTVAPRPSRGSWRWCSRADALWPRKPTQTLPQTKARSLSSNLTPWELLFYLIFFQQAASSPTSKGVLRAKRDVWSSTTKNKKVNIFLFQAQTLKYEIQNIKIYQVLDHNYTIWMMWKHSFIIYLASIRAPRSAGQWRKEVQTVCLLKHFPVWVQKHKLSGFNLFSASAPFVYF